MTHLSRCNFIAYRGGKRFRCTRKKHENGIGSHTIYTKKTGFLLVPLNTMKVAMRNKDFVRGVEAAADVASQYNASTTHPYRLEDCILCKLNVTRRKKARINKTRLRKPDDEFMRGYAVALAAIHLIQNGRQSPEPKYARGSAHVRAAAKWMKLTLKIAKSIGLDPVDYKELKRAGVK